MAGEVRRRRLARLLVAFALFAGIAGSAGAAGAQATRQPFSIPFEEGPFMVDDTCAGKGVVGTLTGTGTLAGQVVETKTTAQHVVTITFHYRVDFKDGSYLLASQRERIVLNENPLVGTHTFGGTLLERGTLYDAGGNVIGHEMFHHRFRITVVDGVPVVEFDEGFITCR